MWRFTVVDNITGKYPDMRQIALTAEWAKGLVYCDMEGFALQEDGEIVIMDTCGNFAYCPRDRFTIKEIELPHAMECECGNTIEAADTFYTCPCCGQQWEFVKELDAWLAVKYLTCSCGANLYVSHKPDIVTCWLCQKAWQHIDAYNYVRKEDYIERR